MPAHTADCDRPHCDLVLLAGARGEEGLEPGAAPSF
eukprot:COSAG02_NODE_1704_length_11240_cov_9.848308_3_plen_36_part_00